MVGKREEGEREERGERREEEGGRRGVGRREEGEGRQEGGGTTSQCVSQCVMQTSKSLFSSAVIRFSLESSDLFSESKLVILFGGDPLFFGDST